jgi:Killing trait
MEATAQAIGNAAQNATAAQQQAGMLAEAVTARCIEALLGGAASSESEAALGTADMDGGPSDQPGALNDQAMEPLEPSDATLGGIALPFAEAAAFQAMAHAAAMAVQNTVLQQQHDHMLRNALTTAAAAALLEGKAAEAEAVMKLADERLGGRRDLSEEITRIGEALGSVGEQFSRRATARPSEPS